MARLFNKSNGRISTENENPEAGGIAGADSSEAALADIKSDEVEVEKNDTEAETAEAVAGQVEELQEFAMESLKNGGLSVGEARLVGMALEGYSKILEIEAKKMLSVESFRLPANRIQSSTYTVEGIGQVLKDVWAKLVEWYKAFTGWVAGHWNKMFGAAEKLEARAKALKDKAKNMSAGKPENATYEDKALAKRLCIGTAVPDNFKASVESTFGFLNKGIEAANRMTDTGGAGEILLEVLDSDDPITKEASVAAPEGATVVDAATAEKHGYWLPSNNLSVYRSPELLGGRAWIGRLPSDGKLVVGGTAAKKAVKADGDKPAVPATPAVEGALNAHAAGVDATITDFDKNVKVDAIKDVIKVLGITEAGEVAAAVEKFAADLRAARGKTEKTNKLSDRFVKSLSRLTKEIDNADTDKLAGLKVKKDIASEGKAIIQFGGIKCASEGLTIAQSVLHHVEKSLAQYKSK